MKAYRAHGRYALSGRYDFEKDDATGVGAGASVLAVVAPVAIAQIDQTSDQSNEAGEIEQELDVSREGEIV